MRGSGRAAAGIAKSDNFGMKPATQEMRVDRKWDKLPALPPGESPPEPVPKDDRPAEMEMEDDGPFDTEETLRSLRPERPSLYHINMPGQTANSCVGGTQQSLAITPPIPHDTISNRENPANTHGYKSSDNLSIHTRDWDLQSCTTDELSIDAHLQHQDHLTVIRNTKDPLHGLPNENASSPESAFYTALIDMAQHHHEQRRVLQRALEAGEILTNEASIRNAITKPTGYAIYSALLASRDPEKWQRIFAFSPTSALPSFKPTMNQDPVGPKSSLIKRFREAGRVLRSLFVAPDSALGRHEPYAGASVCKAKVNMLDTHTPSRQRFVDAAVQTTPPPPPPSHNQNLAHTQHHSSQVAAPAPDWSRSTTLNGATSTDAKLAPVTTQYTQPLHMRGYDADVFVTVLSGDGDSSTFGAGRFAGTQQDGCKGGGKLEMGTEMENEVWEGGSAVTEWPRVEWSGYF
ncbi:hypothetical protein N0V95_006847 [Ascochyta clinopodiicola]|nr:hypothetical protein N0V95_006847 [Ascochyta clinopodiicola]